MPFSHAAGFNRRRHAESSTRDMYISVVSYFPGAANGRSESVSSIIFQLPSATRTMKWTFFRP
jgi:hypothetical protein